MCLITWNLPISQKISLWHPLFSSVSDDLSFSACACLWPPSVPAVAGFRTEIHYRSITHGRPFPPAMSMDLERWGWRFVGQGATVTRCRLQRRWNQGREGSTGTGQCSDAAQGKELTTSDAYIDMHIQMDLAQ
jgi:hypothetical protein